MRQVINMPKALTAYGGIDALVHALESYVSVMVRRARGGCCACGGSGLGCGRGGSGSGSTPWCLPS